MTPQTPDEALYAFMDSELELTEEQHLFDELASSSDLRSEMRDILSIRNAVHRDVASPSPSVETSLLAMTGLATTAGAGAGIAASSAAPWLYGGAGMVAGVALMAALFWNQVTDRSGGIAATTGGTGGSNGNATQQLAANNQPVAPQRVIVYDTILVRKNVAPARPSPTQIPEPISQVPPPSPSADAPPLANGTSDERPLLLGAQSTASGSRMLAQAFSPTMERPAMLRADDNLSVSPVQLRIRSLASGLDAERPTPASVRDAMMPNSSIAFLLPVGQRHRVGFEMGTESFHQQYTGTLSGRPVSYDQTPVLFWMGASYEWHPMDIDIVQGLQTFVSFTGAYAFSQGPVARGSVGLSYRPVGPLSFSVGLDASSLWYQHSNSWFNTAKWGFTYGISVDLGSIR